jgi:hypothetical protein
MVGSAAFPGEPSGYLPGWQITDLGGPHDAAFN